MKDDLIEKALEAAWSVFVETDSGRGEPGQHPFRAAIAAYLAEMRRQGYEGSVWYDIEITPPPQTGEQIEFRGVWRPYPPIEGGSECRVFARWSTLESRPKAKRYWITEGLLGLFAGYNVDWTHWRHVQPLTVDENAIDRAAKKHETTLRRLADK